MKTHPRYSFPLYLSNVSLITGNSVWDAVEPIIIDARTHTWKHAPHPPREPPALNPVKKKRDSALPLLPGLSVSASHASSSAMCPSAFLFLHRPCPAQRHNPLQFAAIMCYPRSLFAVHLPHLSLCHTSPCATPLPVRPLFLLVAVNCLLDASPFSLGLTS